MINIMQNILPIFVVIAVVLTVIFSQLLKKLIQRIDKKDRLNGYWVILPFIFSLIFTLLLCFGEFIEWNAALFWWAAIFGFSVFFYEAIVKHLKKIGEDNEDNTKN